MSEPWDEQLVWSLAKSFFICGRCAGQSSKQIDQTTQYILVFIYWIILELYLDILLSLSYSEYIHTGVTDSVIFLGLWARRKFRILYNSHLIVFNSHIILFNLFPNSRIWECYKKYWNKKNYELSPPIAPYFDINKGITRWFQKLR
jgi:hypothetical protein